MNMNMEAMEALFSRVLNNRDGRMVIRVLHGFIDSHPKTDLEYAHALGMHRIVDIMVDYGGILRDDFLKDDNDGK